MLGGSKIKSPFLLFCFVLAYLFFVLFLFALLLFLFVVAILLENWFIRKRI